jgi:purine-binding chemotaxis protein CheW
MGSGAPSANSGERRRVLLDELRAVEREWTRVRAGLADLGPGETLPGLHLRVGVAGGHVLLPAARIAEIARVVAFDAIPGAPAWLRGGFVWRGAPAVAVDLGARLGAEVNTSLDAVMVILDGTPTVALLVDEVRDLSVDPIIGEAPGEESPLFAGTCRADDRAVPLLALQVIEGEARGFA